MNERDLRLKSGNKLTFLDSYEMRNLKNKGKTLIGCIINTDSCYGGGMHWVSLCIDLEEGKVVMFNSVPENEYK